MHNIDETPSSVRRDDSHVSVVVPVLNGSQIASVMCRTHENWELFVVDDGSGDNTRDIVSAYCEADSRVRLLTHPGNENQGVSHSRKLGFSASTGAYIALLDADDVFTPDKLARQAEPLDQDPDVVLCHGGIEIIDGPDQERFAENINGFATESMKYRYQDRSHSLKTNGICNSMVMIRCSALSRVTYGFPQFFQYEDWTLWTLLCEIGPCFFLKEPLAGYRIHDLSTTSKVLRSPLRRMYSKKQVIDGVPGLLVDELDWEGMGQAMVRLASDPELRVRMGVAAVVVMRPLSTSSQVAKLETLLLEVGSTG